MIWTEASQARNRATGSGTHRAHLQLGGAEGAVGVDVDVQHDGVAFAALAGAPEGGIERVGGFGGHAHQPVGPGHGAGPRRLDGVGVRRVGVGEVVAVAELGVAGAGQPQPDEGALVGGEAELAPQPAVAAVAQAQHPLGLGCRGPVGAVGLFGQGTQQPVELGDQQGRGQGGDLAVAGGGDPAGDADHGVLAQPPGSEQPPSTPAARGRGGRW